MTMVTKNKCELPMLAWGLIMRIEDAIRMGATTIDTIVLDTEFPQINRMHARNPFDILSSIFSFIGDRIVYQNIKIGKLIAKQKEVKINLSYTPTDPTTNSLIFNKKKIQNWCKKRFKFVKNQFINK